MSTELVSQSASDIETQLLSEGLDRIAQASVDRMERIAREDIECEINEHYYDRAHKLMKKLWKECGKRTKHDAKQGDKRSYYGKGYTQPTTQQCSTCHAPLKDGKRKIDWGNRTQRGIRLLAEQMRQADREAGIEYIP